MFVSWSSPQICGSMGSQPSKVMNTSWFSIRPSQTTEDVRAQLHELAHVLFGDCDHDEEETTESEKRN